jgi:HPt (histidine-containing phosphotransfer) domain-containing protein
MSKENVVYIDIDLEDLVPEFLENRKNDVLEIHQLIKDGDIDKIRRIGHNMKGSGGGYGFSEITEFGKIMEQAALSGDVDTIQQTTENLNEYLSTVKIVWQEE